MTAKMEIPELSDLKGQRIRIEHVESPEPRAWVGDYMFDAAKLATFALVVSDLSDDLLSQEREAAAATEPETVRLVEDEGDPVPEHSSEAETEDEQSADA